MYQTAIVLPKLVSGDPERVVMALGQVSRFVPFIWMGLITVLVTGLGLMLFSTRFVFFSYSDWWSVALAMKQMIIFLMTVFTFGYVRMLTRFAESVANQAGPGSPPPFLARMLHFHRLNVVMGVIATLLSASMR